MTVARNILPPRWIMISGPYTSGSADEAQRQRNLDALVQAALAIFEKGFVPIVGVACALPLVHLDPHPDAFERLVMPLSLALAERCDACLRLGGPSHGADQEVALFRAARKPVFFTLEEMERTCSTGLFMEDTLESAKENDPSTVAEQVINPILGTIMSARQALDICESIEKYANEINEKFSDSGSPFGFIQLMSLERAILDVCKLYDTSSRHHKKHTVPELLETMKKESPTACEHWKERIPTKDNNEVFEKCLFFRDKKIAHSENLFVCPKDKLPDFYPPLEGLRALIELAWEICRLAMYVYKAPITLGFHDLKMSMLHIIKSTLEKDATSEEMIDFYKRKDVL